MNEIEPFTILPGTHVQDRYAVISFIENTYYNFFINIFLYIYGFYVILDTKTFPIKHIFFNYLPTYIRILSERKGNGLQL